MKLPTLNSGQQKIMENVMLVHDKKKGVWVAQYQDDYQQFTLQHKDVDEALERMICLVSSVQNGHILEDAPQ